jgi:Sulfotransferase family
MPAAFVAGCCLEARRWSTRVTISEAGILAQAKDNTGLSDFGDDWFRGALAAYVSDLDGEHLSDWGRTFLARQVVKDLARRLAIIDCLKKNPQIEEQALPPILYITGHERSGTTFLHNVMSQHRLARYLSRWELMKPTPPPEAASFADDPRRAEVGKSIEALRGTELESMHWVEADDPEECTWGLMDCTGTMGMAPSFILPNWRRWLRSQDMTQTFVNYRKVIALLTWKNPVPAGGFLVLKAPMVSSYLPSFSKAFPEARFLFIHRDPHRVLASMCTLTSIVNASFLADGDYLSQTEVRSGVILERMKSTYTALEEFGACAQNKVVNVDYATLVRSPEAQVSRVYSELGGPQDPGLQGKVRQFLSRQREGGRVSPRPGLIDFGYRREQILAVPEIAHYIKHFGVTLEESRLTGHGSHK